MALRTLTAATGTFTLTGQQTVCTYPKNIYDPDTGKLTLRKLRARWSPYATADAAYNAWCSTLGLDPAVSEYSAATINSYRFAVIPLKSSPVDWGSYLGVVVQNNAIALYINDPVATDQTYYSTITYQGGDARFGAVPMPTNRPMFLLGTETSMQFNTSLVYDASSIKTRTGINPSTGAREFVYIGTRQQSGNYLVRWAVRLAAGYLEMVVTTTAASQDVGYGTRIQYVIGSEATDVPSGGAIITTDFIGTVQILSDNLSSLRVVQPESLALTDPAPTYQYKVYPPLSETMNYMDYTRLDIGALLSDTHAFTDSTLYLFKAGALVQDVMAFLDTQSPTLKISLQSDEVMLLTEAVNAAYPFTVADSMAFTDAATAVAGVIVLDALGFLDPATPTVKYYQSLLEAIAASDSLRNFFAGLAADTFNVAETVVGMPRYNPALADVFAFTDPTTPICVFRVIAPDNIKFTDAQLYKWIYKPTLTDGVTISAGFVDPSGGFTTWAINTRTRSVTQYSNWAFNGFANVGHKYLGSASDGLYEIGGNTDNGTNIVARIKGGFAQFAGSHLASLKAVYLGMRGTGQLVMNIETADGRTYTYQTVQQNMNTTRIRVGKGLRARYYSFELVTAGQDFDLDSVEFIPLAAQRRV